MNHAIMLLGFCIILILSPGCERESGKHIIKDIAGKNTFAIGEQVWNDSFLDVDRFVNGESIPHAKNDKEWRKAGEMKQPAWCYSEGDSQCKLYNWYAVSDSRGLIPKGWHLPTSEEIHYLKILFYTLNHLEKADGDFRIAYPSAARYEREYDKDVNVLYSLPFEYHGQRFGSGAYKGSQAIAVCWTGELPDTSRGYIPVFAQLKEQKQLYTVAAHPANGIAIRLIKD